MALTRFFAVVLKINTNFAGVRVKNYSAPNRYVKVWLFHVNFHRGPVTNAFSISCCVP